MVVYNQIGDTIMVVVNLEELCQTWLADIQTSYHDNLLAQQGEREDTDIGCHECFTSPDVEEVNIITFSSSFSIN